MKLNCRVYFQFPFSHKGFGAQMSKRKSSSAGDRPNKRVKPVEREDEEDENINVSQKKVHQSSKQVCSATAMLWSVLLFLFHRNVTETELIYYYFF